MVVGLELSHCLACFLDSADPPLGRLTKREEGIILSISVTVPSVASSSFKDRKMTMSLGSTKGISF
jgi:hypothetical protein